MAESVFIRLLIFFWLAVFLGTDSNAWAREKSELGFYPAQQRKITSNYRIKFDENDAFLADVEAQIDVTKGRLFMAPWGADNLPNGWASFVKNLRITDSSGKTVNYELKQSGRKSTGGARSLGD